jgi:ribosome-associated heat shock protein Hsp15
MRIDKFLNAVNITKRRSISSDMLKHNVVLINNVVVKKSKDIKLGDIITIKYLEKTSKFEVLKIPTSKSTPKSKIEEYIKIINQGIY